MAGITDLQRNYLELLMKNYPEYKAGFMNTVADADYFPLNPPVAPLYDVQPDYTSDSYFEEGPPVETGSSPRGPLHNIDLGRTQDIMDRLDQNLIDPTRAAGVSDPSNVALDNFFDTLEMYDDNSMSQFSSPRKTTSYAEWQPKDGNFTKAPLSNITLRDGTAPGYSHLWGSTYGPVINPAGETLVGPIGINKDLMDLVGTKPTSPRNEQLIDASAIGLGMRKPVDINKFAADVLGHEYGHNVLAMPGFEDIRKEVIGTNINELFGNTMAAPHVDQGLSADEKEELFNELLDLQRGYRTTGKMSGILSRQNVRDMNWKLKDFMKNKPKWGSAAMDYTNLMSPVADRYFAEVDRQGGQNPSAQSFRSAPGGLTQAQSRAARGDSKGTGGGWKWADGGLATMFERRR